MMKDFFVLELPNYEVNFEENKNYKYSDNGKENLKKALLSASRGYCMYCYTRVKVDRKNYGQLEHSVEQDIAPILSNCHHNISIACPTCNQSLKKREQGKRKIEIEEELTCDFSCGNIPCETYYKVTNKYISNLTEKDDIKKIILRPRGVIQGNIPEERVYYKVAYDLLNCEFIPYGDERYLLESKKYIKEHIEKFCLNDEEYKTKEIEKVVEDIIDLKQIPNKTRYNNLVAELFIEKLEKIYSKFGMERVLNICTTIETMRVLKNN